MEEVCKIAYIYANFYGADKCADKMKDDFLTHVDLGVLDVGELGARVVAPDDHVLHILNRHARLDRDLQNT